jgi:hypothetical protein
MYVLLSTVSDTVPMTCRTSSQMAAHVCTAVYRVRHGRIQCVSYPSTFLMRWRQVCSKNQISVDVFCCSEGHADLATLVPLSKYTNGQVRTQTLSGLTQTQTQTQFNLTSAYCALRTQTLSGHVLLDLVSHDRAS